MRDRTVVQAVRFGPSPTFSLVRAVFFHLGKGGGSSVRNISSDFNTDREC